MEEEIKTIGSEIGAFIESLKEEKEQPPMTLFVKEMGWVPVKFMVPVMSTDGTPFLDIISPDGSFHQIRDDHIIDKRTNIVTKEILEQFMRMMGESLETPTPTTNERNLYG